VSAPTSLRPPVLSWSAVGALARRPGLWPTAVAALLRLAVPGWWRRRPYLPLPDDRWWAFRMVTSYGRPDAEPQAGDVISYLEWCRSTMRWEFRELRPGATPTGQNAPTDGQPG
jgi:hypothetical protein